MDRDPCDYETTNSWLPVEIIAFGIYAFVPMIVNFRAMMSTWHQNFRFFILFSYMYSQRQLITFGIRFSVLVNYHCDFNFLNFQQLLHILYFVFSIFFLLS